MKQRPKKSKDLMEPKVFFRLSRLFLLNSHLKMGFPNPLEAENFFKGVGSKAPKY